MSIFLQKKNPHTADFYSPCVNKESELFKFQTGWFEVMSN